MLGMKESVLRPRERTASDIGRVDAIIMDLDGVITDTARLHAAAWMAMFDSFLEERRKRYGEAHESFTNDDYIEHIDGKPRADGVRAFLTSRGIKIPEGRPDDPPDLESVWGLGNRKNLIYLDSLERGIAPLPSVERALQAWRGRGVKLALVSASRNARRVLELCKLADAFDMVVDSNDLEALGLKGKPSPDLFLEAARRLDVAPDRAAVVEDALAGVEAGRAGGFAVVVGIDRRGRSEELRRHGADIVVGALGDIAPEDDLPSALDRSDEIFQQLKAGNPAVFLDYDGTLTPIVARPDLAVLAEDMRETVRRLSEECPVVVVSGRGLEDVMNMMAVDSIGYAGSHGLEMEGAEGSFQDNERGMPYVAALDDAERELRPAVDSVQGALLERKRFALALHYRLVPPDDLPRLEEAFDRAVRDHPQLRRMGGKKVFELRPDLEWNKGNAVRSFMEHLSAGGSGIVPLYIGDDVTDEDAFRAIEDVGIGILVSDRPRDTAARYRLADVAEVQVFLDRLAIRFQSRGARAWSLVYDVYEPSREQLREALCALGNGYMATRASAPESAAGEIHYPGAYIAGIYDRLESDVQGRTVENESNVNLPNWAFLTFRIEDEEWFEIDRVLIDRYRQELDMLNGVLVRDVTFTDDRGRRTTVRQRRLVSMDVPNLAAVELTITPENWSGTLTVRSAIDGRVANTLVARYRELDNQHLVGITPGSDGQETVWLEAETRQSGVKIAEAARTRVFHGQKSGLPRAQVLRESMIGQDIEVEAVRSQAVRVEKAAAIHSSRDRAISDVLTASLDLVAHSGDFEELLGEHSKRWRMLWSRYGIEVDPGHLWISQILNLHIFHLLENASVHSVDLDVGIGPRGLAGEAYRGLIMWDELFIFPFLNLHGPDLTRSLLLYRFRRLRMARWAARDAGFEGAMFPWMSGSDGRERAQTVHLNPLSGRWIEDNSHLEQHVGLAIAYNVWQYYQVTNDLNFMSLYGTELLCEIARFWVSRCSYDPKLDRFVIRKVMGPDEFHEGYPDAEEPGVDNNAYTNVMVAWTLERALEALRELPLQYHRDVLAELSLDQEELDRWKDIASRIHVPFHGDGVISQFDGYDQLKEIDLKRYRGKYCSLHRMDRILEAEGDSIRNYKLSKQADVLMLLYLFSEDELRQQLAHMGYEMGPEAFRRTIEYYSGRTAHGSTLSRVVFAWVLSRYNRESSWNLFLDALRSDVSDIQCGTTHEGVHLGAMASTVDIVQRCYSGLETRGDALLFDPRLPSELKRLKFRLEYRQHLVEVEIGRERMRLVSLTGGVDPISVGHRGKMFVLEPGGTLEVLLSPAS